MEPTENPDQADETIPEPPDGCGDDGSGEPDPADTGSGTIVGDGTGTALPPLSSDVNELRQF